MVDTFDDFLANAGKRRGNGDETFVQTSYIFDLDLARVKYDVLDVDGGDFSRWLRIERGKNAALDAAIRAGDILADDDGIRSGRHCAANAFRLATQAMALYLATHGTGRGALPVDVQIAIVDMDGEHLTLLTDDADMDEGMLRRRMYLLDGKLWTFREYAKRALKEESDAA